MKRIVARLFSVIQQAAEFTYHRQLLAIGIVVFLCSIFLPSGEKHAIVLFEDILLILGGLGLLSSGRRMIGPSTILAACTVYLAAMMLASVLGPDATAFDLRYQAKASALIFVFLLMAASLVSAYPDFTRRLFFWMGVAVALSAAVNIYLYFVYLSPGFDRPIWMYRLRTSVGMRDYANSTNISATYAIYFVGACTLLAQARLTLVKRVFLATGAVVLLFGLLLTQSRGGLIAAAMGIAAIVLTAAPRPRMAAIAAMLAVVILVALVPATQEAFFHRGSSYRFEVWQKFMPLIWDHVWIGNGPYSPAGITVNDKQFLDQAHNLVLSAWFRAGIGGALAMAYILVGGLFWTVRYWKASRDILPFNILATVVTAGMVDYQLMVTYPTWPWVTFWLPFGLAAGAEMASRRMRTAGGQQPSQLAIGRDEQTQNARQEETSS